VGNLGSVNKFYCLMNKVVKNESRLFAIQDNRVIRIRKVLEVNKDLSDF
jgi:hypothetical protein